MGRILIVDDEESDRLFERSILADEGHALYFAADGESALKIYRDHEIELVITDLHMPRLNGLRLIQELKELDADVAIIAVSGVAADQLDLATALGARRALFKPLDPHLLVETVAEVMKELASDDPWAFRDR